MNHRNDSGIFSLTLYNLAGRKQEVVLFSTFVQAMEYLENTDLNGGSATIHRCLYNTIRPPRQKWEIPNELNKPNRPDGDGTDG